MDPTYSYHVSHYHLPMKHKSLHFILSSIFWPLLLLSTAARGQSPTCTDEAGCFPTAGNLALGRMVAVSSVCATGSEALVFGTTITIPCDPNDQHSPNGLSDNSNRTFWISEIGGDSPVTLRLDFESSILFNQMTMVWASARPQSMVLERSGDNGESWQVYRYYSASCDADFGLPDTAPDSISTTDAICTSAESSITSGLVTFDTSQHLPPGTSVELSQAYRLATNLRATFLSQFPDLSTDNRLEYYAVAEWIVEGSCMCNGHASSCASAPGETVNAEKEVFAGCVCQHNTMGTHCEQCATGFNSLPWTPGTETEANVCQECMCNGHATDCQYNAELDSAVCVNCADGTMGNSCDQCLPQFYRNMDVQLDDPNVCIACNCNPAGDLDDGVCNEAGQCSCKSNVDPASLRCDTCQIGYWNLSADNPLGCQVCDCNSTGTVQDTTCDPFDGVCTCKEGVGGRQCDNCQSGSFGFSENGCQACDCNSTGTVEGTTCDPFDGVCTCKEGVAGRRCDSCQSGSVGFSERGCHRELVFGLDFLPFVDTGNSAIFLEHNPNDDDCSNPISIADSAFNAPLPFGSTNQTVLYVCENGLISFGSAWDGSLAEAAAHTTFEFPLSGAYLIAPLWSDVDISDPDPLQGEIFYQTFSDSGDESLSIVSRFVEYQYNISFAGQWMFVAKWNNVHPIPQDDDPRTNTYQAVIITDRNQAYVVFTYLCGNLEWTETMHLGILSTVGVNADRVYYENHPLSRTENLASIACQNNDSGIPWSNVVYALNPAVLIETPPERQIVDFLELQSGIPLQLSCSAAFFGVTEAVSVGWSYLDNLCVCAIGDTQTDSPVCNDCNQTTRIGSQSVNTVTATLTIQQITTPGYTCQIFSSVQVGILMDSATTTIKLQVPLPTVSISAAGSVLFGEPYNLTCTAEQADTSIPIVALIEWLIDARGGDISPGPTELQGTITSRTLSFSFLNALQHNGVYICRVTFVDSSGLFLLPPEILHVEGITVPPAIIAADNKTALLGENITLAFTVFADVERITWYFQANGAESSNSIDIACGESILLAGTNSMLKLLCGFGEGLDYNLSIISVTPEAAGSYILSITDPTGVSAQNLSTLTVQPIDVTQCGRLCDIATIVEPEKQAEELVNITANTEELDTDDIATASVLLDDLTQSAIADIEVMMDYLQTIDNVLRVDPSVLLESQMQSQSSTRILYSLGNVTANVSLPGNSTSMIYTGVTYGLHLQDVDAADFEGQRFSINLGSVEEATRSNRTSAIDQTVLRNMLTQDATANVEVSENLDFGQPSGKLQRLVLSFYLQDSFFRVINTTISSIVVGLESPNVITASSPAPERRRRQISEELSPAVNFEFQVAENSEETNCSGFNPGGNGGVGAWSSDNCRPVVCPPGREQQTCCECYQLGHFGLLLAPTPTAAFNNLLTVLSYIGAGLSLICLLLTLVTFLSSRKLRNKVSGQLLLNLAVSLIGLYVVFITAGNILVYGKSTTTEVLCGINSALIQYFLLVYFGWTAAEAVQIYYWQIVKALESKAQHLGHYVLKVALIVWLVPLVIVAVSAGAGYRFYTNDVYCRAVQWPFWFALVLPLGVIFIFDWIVFILIMKALHEHAKKYDTKKKTKYDGVKKNVRNAALLTTLFGMGWVFGLVATGFPGEDTEVLTLILQVFFCIIVGLQGVLLFFFNVVQLDEANDVWKGWYSKLTKHLPCIRKYKVSEKRRQEKRERTPQPGAMDSTTEGLTLSLSRDSALSPGTPSPRQQFAESLTITEGLETSGRYHPHAPAVNSQAQPWITSPSSISEEFLSSPLTETSSLADFDNLDLVDWV